MCEKSNREAKIQREAVAKTAADGEDQKGRYTEAGFWDKVRDQAKSAGKEVIEAALKLYFALQDPDTPASAKLIIAGALAYFIVPTDAVLDLLPGGYVDDLGALVGALWTVAEHIKDEHSEKAKAKLAQWFETDKQGESENSIDIENE